MALNEPTRSVTSVINERDKTTGQVQHNEEAPVTLSRWLVSFGCEPEWYPVGEFVALDAAAAIDRAIEIFGGACGHRAEEIPWDAAPLPKMNPPSLRRDR
jgi:hypothetical protein